MLKLQVIGNLGRDAEIKDVNGHRFISFSVAHTDKYKNTKGEDVETTTWVGCTMHSNAESLLPYLRKGTKIFASGRCSQRVFHNAKTGLYECALDMRVESIELCGRPKDDTGEQVPY